MKSTWRKRPRIGDVVRIVSENGEALAQYTHLHAEFGALVRVIGPATGDPASPEAAEIAKLPTQFATFFPLAPAHYMGLAEILGKAPIPPDWRKFPTFRQAVRRDRPDGGPCSWLLWDGRVSWVVPELRPEQYAYPIRATMDHELLVERALSGWTHVAER